jgi:Flp pilus assembly protein TadD
MRRLALAASTALLLAGCAGAQQGSSTSNDPARNMRVAAAAERGGQFEVALSLYAAAAEANPGDPVAAERLASLLIQAGNPRRALDALAEARQRHPANAALLQAEARARLELGEPERALALFDEHLRMAPGDVRSHNGRGVALDLLGHHAEARLSYRAARAADPRSSVATGNLALSLMLSGCPDAAMSLLEAAPRAANTADWLGQMQGLARNLSAGSGADPQSAALRRALPPASEPCSAAG